MARLINFNMTSFCIAMSDKPASETLAAELELLPKALESISLSRDGRAVILARLVRGLSEETWREVSQAWPLNQWQALPAKDELEADEDVEFARQNSGSLLPVTPFREARGALTRSAFVSLLKREMLRLSRNGGILSIVSAALANRRNVAASLGDAAVARLDSLLGAILLDRMDCCDALGVTRRGVYVCSLPGLGQLATRHFAETCQKAFRDAARPFFPSGGLGAGNGGACAMGIVNIMQGETCSVADILKRARATLDAALRKTGGHMHQESALAPFEGTTLVHSSEKRFLFFGGDPS